jgi:predicted secreted protein
MRCHLGENVKRRMMEREKYDRKKTKKYIQYIQYGIITQMITQNIKDNVIIQPDDNNKCWMVI